MTRRFVDLSDYQAGLNVDAVASSVDGAWCKVGDWSWIARYGWPADDIHEAVIRRFLALGKPVGSYLFVRPGWTSPSTQIDAWRAHCPDCTVSPMIDLEVNGTLSGGSLRDWVDEALARTAQVFGMTPVLYWSNTFANAYGMSAPGTPHIPMVAEYHRGYQTQLWSNVAGWESWAYAAYGGPDVPPGYGGDVTPRSLIWQWTSSAQLPGFAGLVDCDFVPDAAYALLTNSALPPASADDIEAILMADPNLAANLAEFVRVFCTPGQLYYLGDIWNRTNLELPLVDSLFHHVTDGNRLLQMYALLANADLPALALIRDNYNALHIPGFDLPSEVRALQAAIDKAASGGVDVDQLVSRVVAGVAASGVKADVDEAALARAVRAEFAAALGLPTAVTAVDAATGPPPALPDVRVEARAATALADLAASVYDEDTGIIATVARDVAKMTRTAPGAEPTATQIHDALLAAGADATRRAAEKARAVPPLPPVDPPRPAAPAGDMGGAPPADQPSTSTGG